MFLSRSFLSDRWSRSETMLWRLIDFSLDYRWIILSITAAIVVAGVYTIWTIPIEAFPDLTNVQVVVTTECPGMSPTEVEQLVTFPLETALLGVPDAQGVRSISRLGLSMVTVVFDDEANIFLARQLVTERLNDAQSRLPQGLQPVMGPLASVFGEAYQYILESAAVPLETSDFVSPQGNRGAAPFGQNGRMMSFLLGQSANTIRKSQRLSKIREAKCPLEPWDAVTLVQSPFGYLGLQFPNIRIRYSRRVAPTSCALFASQFAHE